MATAIDENEKILVDKLVYKAYSPAKCGKVIEDMGWHTPQGMRRACRIIKVKWINGTVTQELAYVLNDYEALVEDHRKKYEKFSKVVEELKELK
jgi:hypothetical protein